MHFKIAITSLLFFNVLFWLLVLNLLVSLCFLCSFFFAPFIGLFGFFFSTVFSLFCNALCSFSFSITISFSNNFAVLLFCVYVVLAQSKEEKEKIYQNDEGQCKYHNAKRSKIVAQHLLIQQC